MASLTSQLAEFVAGSSFKDLPDRVILEAKRCFIDWVGVALAASRSPTAKVLSGLVRDLGGQKQATVIGSALRTTAPYAALVNGSIAHVLDFDDLHAGAITHTSAVLVPATLAGGEWKGRGGKEMISAFVSGYEAVVRAGSALGGGNRQLQRGWHPTSTVGRIGAATCFGKLIRLNSAQMATAMGIAGAQSSGLKKVFGTMAKHLNSGKAAHDGVLSALLAARGFTAPDDILEGEDGLCKTLTGHFEPGEVLKGLGQEYEILNNAFKSFPSCYQTHAVIDGCLEISGKLSSPVSEVKEIVCEVNPTALKTAAIADPHNPNEAKFSLAYCAARGVMGNVSMQHFVKKEIEKEDVRALMKRVSLRVNPSFTGMANARVQVKTKDGATLTSEVDGLRGGPSKPMNEDEMDQKFMSLVSPALKSEKKAQNALEILRELETLKDVTRFMKSLVRPA
jgi:2-methylcitrate dehydratase PrpD